jgi:DNA-binding CsgD family transcriptional regulator
MASGSVVPSMADMLDVLAESPPVSSSSSEEKERVKFQTLPIEERCMHALKWRKQGVEVDAIAKIFGVKAQTVYKYLKRANELFREQFQNVTAADLVAEDWQFILSMRDTCLYEVSQLGKDGKVVDPKTGKVEDTADRKGQHELRVKYIGHATKLQQMLIDLQLNTGLIPKEAGRLYHTLEEEGKPSDEGTRQLQKMDRNALVADILESLEGTQSLL